MFNQPCTLDEATLLDYISGSASPDIRAAVEGSPACRAAAEQLARELRPLLQAMYRVTCPDPDTLVAYQEGRLDSTSQLVYRRHLAECPHCRA
ncbi:MAG TPA: zf-HC2 domain-containing protein, partial [Herpetosiphonaceae bacterium]